MFKEKRPITITAWKGKTLGRQLHIVSAWKKLNCQIWDRQKGNLVKFDCIGRKL